MEQVELRAASSLLAGGTGGLALAVATPSASVSPSEVPDLALILQPVSDPFLCPEPGENKEVLAGS